MFIKAPRNCNHFPSPELSEVTSFREFWLPLFWLERLSLPSSPLVIGVNEPQGHLHLPALPVVLCVSPRGGGATRSTGTTTSWWGGGPCLPHPECPSEQACSRLCLCFILSHDKQHQSRASAIPSTTGGPAVCLCCYFVWFLISVDATYSCFPESPPDPGRWKPNALGFSPPGHMEETCSHSHVPCA